MRASRYFDATSYVRACAMPSRSQAVAVARGHVRDHAYCTELSLRCGVHTAMPTCARSSDSLKELVGADAERARDREQRTDRGVRLSLLDGHEMSSIEARLVGHLFEREVALRAKRSD